jgi:uncharacterized protein (DUF58 family)
MLTTLKQTFRNWLFRPQIASGTVTLNQRRIFILPTRRGLGFACILLLMLLGDINYNLSLGYVLTFLLGTTAAMTMLHAFRNMAQLEIHAGHNEPAFAGDTAGFVFYLKNNSKLPRFQLKLSQTKEHFTCFDLAALAQEKVELLLPAKQRGWLDSGRLTLSTEFPLGLFYAWSYLHFDTRCLIYPRPGPTSLLPKNSAQEGTGKLTGTGDEDFAGLRAYVAGDPLPRIAWKTLARGQDLQVKQFNAQQGSELWLDEILLSERALEQKLEQLTRWVLDAEAQGLRYGLRLSGVDILPQQGSAHLAECLRTLALYRLEPR